MTDETPVPAEQTMADALVLAQKCGWSRPVEFAAALPATDDQAVRLFTAAGDSGADQLRRRLAERPHAAQIDVTPLEDIDADAGLALHPNRALAVLRCGELLTPAAVEAAAAIVHRPAGSGLVVLSHAEVLAGPDDLDLVQRGIWRTLFADAPLAWAGQDLSEYGVLLWADPSAEPAAFLAARLARDADRLAAWWDGPGDAGAELQAGRATHLLDLMEHAAEVAEHQQPATEAHRAARRLTQARTQAAELRRRWLKRLDEDRAMLTRQLEASLNVLEQELLSALREATQRQPRHTQRVRDRLDQELHGWAAAARELAARHAAEDHSDLVRLADELDWEVIEGVVRDEMPYRNRLLTGGRFTVGFEGLGPRARPTGERPTQGGRSAWPSRAAAGVAIGVGAAILVGDDPLLTLALGTAGAAGGAASAYFTGQETGRRAAADARRVVSQRVGEMRDTVRDRLRSQAEAARTDAAATFDALDEQLAAAVHRTEQHQAGAPSDTAFVTARQRVTELRARLRAATGM